MSRDPKLLLARVLLVLYLVWVLSMTLLPLPAGGESRPDRTGGEQFRWNLVPFETILRQVEHGTTWQKVRQLGGNVLVFAPFGVFLPLTVPGWRSWRAVLLAGLSFSAAIELAQLVASALVGEPYRVADVDDVILNVAGVLLGFAAYRLARKVAR